MLFTHQRIDVYSLLGIIGNAVRSPQVSPDRGDGLKGRKGCTFEPACENPVTYTVIQKATSQSVALTALLVGETWDKASKKALSHKDSAFLSIKFVVFSEGF